MTSSDNNSAKSKVTLGHAVAFVVRMCVNGMRRPHLVKYISLLKEYPRRFKSADTDCWNGLCGYAGGCSADGEPAEFLLLDESLALWDAAEEVLPFENVLYPKEVRQFSGAPHAKWGVTPERVATARNLVPDLIRVMELADHAHLWNLFSPTQRSEGYNTGVILRDAAWGFSKTAFYCAAALTKTYSMIKEDRSNFGNLWANTVAPHEFDRVKFDARRSLRFGLCHFMDTASVFLRDLAGADVTGLSPYPANNVSAYEFWARLHGAMPELFKTPNWLGGFNEELQKAAERVSGALATAGGLVVEP